VLAYLFRVPFADWTEVALVVTLGIVGCGYFVFRELEAADKWWANLEALFPTGYSGIATPSALTLPRLSTIAPWQALHPLVITDGGMLISYFGVPLPIHVSMFATTADFEQVHAWFVAGLEQRAA
jgi:hypothetical protein